MDGHYDLLDLTTAPIEDVEAKVKYVATPEEHNANVQAAIALGYPSLAQGELTKEPIALVCSGPSLTKTRREIRHFDKILTCSGAHKYLLEHGMVPTWHIVGDPREHASFSVIPPHRRVQYLIASSCHPAVFKALKGYTVKIWHSLKDAEDLLTLGHYPPGHWVLTGGTNVGMRALVVARVLGYTDIHIFGMDCSAESREVDGDEYQAMHTGFHPNEPPQKKYRMVRVGGRDYQTTTLFLSYAKQFFHEMLQLPDVHTTLHGEGLLQALVKAKLEDPDQLTDWLERMGNVVDTTIAVVQRPVEAADATPVQ